MTGQTDKYILTHKLNGHNDSLAPFLLCVCNNTAYHIWCMRKMFQSANIPKIRFLFQRAFFWNNKKCILDPHLLRRQTTLNEAADFEL